MMKKAYVMVWMLVLLLSVPVVQPEAGTFVAGTKLWYEATWDSAMLDIYDQIFAGQLADGGFYNVTSDTHVGSGYLAGPVLGYQTGDNIWSFSVAPMVLSHFSQKIVGTALTDIDLLGIPFPVQGNSETSVDVTRMDIDLAVSYALLQFRESAPFLEYCKLFLGFKYEDVDYDFKVTTRVAADSLTDTVGFDYEVYMPTVGIGFVYPLTDDIAAGIQGGIGMAFFEGVDVDDGFAYNFEANVNILPMEKMIVQFGYRFQEFAFDLRVADSGEKYKSKDRTYGPTVTFIYTF